ncbi:MAG: hypothetical protein AGIKBDMD_01699 [Synergistaceae bacterium]|nr:DUF4392 domain-containing protein [Synergistaceae bacterium]
MEKYRLPSGFAEELVNIVASNKGKRGISNLCKHLYLQKAAEVLADVSKVAVVSGFFVPSSGAPETDGPGGAVVLARAFWKHGAETEIWTDDLCLDAIRASAAAAGFPEEKVIAVDRFDKLDSYSPDAVVFTERLGRAADGKYYNMRSEDISAWTPPLDWISVLCSRNNIFTVGIGDGGNEVGMGNFVTEICNIRPDFRKCLSVIRTDVTIPVDVSNWGCYALSTALSCIWREWLGPGKNDERSMLEALIEKKAVDGISKKSELTVDGFEIDVHEGIISELYEIWNKYSS